MASHGTSSARTPVVLFPRSMTDLTSTTQCPACFTTLTSSVCGRCGLDLASPAATELAQVSATAAANLDRRLALIAQMRATSGNVTASEPHGGSSVGAVEPAPQPSLTPPAQTGTADATPRRHLGAQVILLIVGVSLLAVGAIFFLVYAFITFGLVWRSMIIASVTLVSIIGASILRRRGLTATGESISALAIVFIYLDVYAIRANDFFGSATTNGLTYWGLCLALAAAGLTVWHRFAGLRVPSIVASATFGPGVALLVGGVTEQLPDSTRWFSAFAALGASALVAPLALRAPGRRLAEGRITVMLSGLGLGIALGLGFVVAPDVVWAPALALAIVALLAAAVVLVIARVGAPRLPALGIAAIGAVAGSASGLAVTTRNSDFTTVLGYSPIIAAIVALVLERLCDVARGRVLRPAALVAAWSATAVTTTIIVLPLVTAVGPVIELVRRGGQRWSVSGGAVTALETKNFIAVLALAIIWSLAATAWLLARRGRGRVSVVLWGAVVTLIVAAPLMGQLWLTVVGWLAIAGVALGLLARARMASVAHRLPLAAGFIAAALLAYCASWASIDTWWYGSVGVVILLVLVRTASPSVVIRAISLAGAIMVAFVAIGSEGWHANERFQSGAGALTDSTHFVGALAAVLLVVGAVLARRASRAEARVLFWSAFGAALAASGLSWVLGSHTSEPRALVLGEFGTSVVLGVATMVVLATWIAAERTRPFIVERVAAAVALAPVFGWLVDSVMRSAGAPEWARSLAPVTAGLVVASASLALAVLGPTPVPRWARDAGIGLVTSVTVIAQTVSPSEPTWLIFVIAGVITLVIALSADGLIGSRSPRRYLGWLAVGLGTAGLWIRLDHNGVTAVEAYVLPVAGVLLIIALLLDREASAVTGRAAPSPAAAGIALAGLAVALIPIAVVATSGGATRAIVVASVAAVLSIVSAIRGPAPLRGYQDSAALVALPAAAIATFGRAVQLSMGAEPSGANVDAWVAAGFIVLALSAVIQAHVPERPRLRSIASQCVLGLGAGIATAIELSLIGHDALGTARAAIVLVALGAIHVGGLTWSLPPLTVWIGWLGVALGAAVAATGIARGALDPVEWAAAAVAVPLLIAGAGRLARDADARSWPWLAPGVVVLLLPSLIGTFDQQPLWRLVGLGIASLAVLVAGALLRLQAPLILGSAIVVVHAARTFAPQIVAVYQLTQWWVWAVIGGAIVLFLGITFEKRLRDLRAAGSRLGQLR